MIRYMAPATGLGGRDPTNVNVSAVFQFNSLLFRDQDVTVHLDYKQVQLSIFIHALATYSLP